MDARNNQQSEKDPGWLNSDGEMDTAKIEGLVSAIFDSEEEARRWFETPREAFEYMSADTLMKTDLGRALVEMELKRLAARMSRSG